MKPTSMIEWVTDRNPEARETKLVALRHENGTRITSIGAWRVSYWDGDDGYPMEDAGWAVEAWADLPRFDGVPAADKGAP